MKPNLFPVAKSVLIVTALVSALWVSAGSLAPPPGPITPTMKDLDDVEPRIAIRNDFDTLTPVQITFSGSYYLAEDILAFPARDGIEITASNVTLDLNGFTIYGNLEVGSLDGIKVTGTRSNITVRNGVVRDFFGMGLNLTFTENALVEQVHAANNLQRGISMGSSGVVKSCTARGNGSLGIWGGQGAVVSDSSASENANQGIFVGPGALVSNCTANDNGETGITASISLIEHCTARNNSQDGIISSSGTVTGCTAADNTLAGISTQSSHVFGNKCTNNATAGIVTNGGGCRIDSNDVAGNNIGIQALNNGSVIVRNSARSNPGGNYVIAGGNDLGPIGTAAASASPWANISY
jgi:hypothetical protein